MSVFIALSWTCGGAPMFPSHGGRRVLGDLGQELVVATGGLDLLDEQLQARRRVAVAGQGVEHPAQLPDLLELVAVEEQLLVAGGRAVDLDGRVDAALGQPPVEAQLHVAGALELLEYDLVHAAARLHQGGGQDGEGTALLHVAGGAEELLGRVQGAGVDATRHDPPGGGLGQVVGAGQAGDAVEDDDHVAAQLHQAAGPFDGQLGDVGVLLGGPVEGGGDDLTLDRPAHVGHLFGPFVDEEDHQVHVWVVALDGVGNLLENARLSRFGRRHDETPLALADGRYEVHDARRQVGGVAGDLQAQALVGKQGGEALELGPVAGIVGVHAGDVVHPHQGGVLLIAARRAGRTFYVVALAEGEAANLADGDVHVLGPGQEAGGAQEPVALVSQVEKTFDLQRLSAELRFGTGLALQLPFAALAPVPPPPAAVAAVAGLAVEAAGPFWRLGGVVVGAVGGRAGCVLVARRRPPRRRGPAAGALGAARGAAGATPARAGAVGPAVSRGGGLWARHPLPSRWGRLARCALPAAGAPPATGSPGAGARPRAVTGPRRPPPAPPAGALTAGAPPAGSPTGAPPPAGTAELPLAPTSAGSPVVALRARVRRGRSAASGAGSTPVACRIWLIRSAFLALVVGLVPRASAIAKSSSRSLASRTERSSCTSLIYYLFYGAMVGSRARAALTRERQVNNEGKGKPLGKTHPRGPGYSVRKTPVASNCISQVEGGTYSLQVGVNQRRHGYLADGHVGVLQAVAGENADHGGTGRDGRLQGAGDRGGRRRLAEHRLPLGQQPVGIEYLGVGDGTDRPPRLRRRRRGPVPRRRPPDADGGGDRMGRLHGMAGHDGGGPGRLETEHPGQAGDLAGVLVLAVPLPVGGYVAGVAHGQAVNMGGVAEDVADLESCRFLPLDPVRVDGVDDGDGGTVAEGTHEIQSSVEIATYLQHTRPVNQRLRQLAEGDETVGYQHRAGEAGPAGVGGRRRRSVARAPAHHRPGALFHRLGNGDGHAPVLEGAGGIGAFHLQPHPCPHPLGEVWGRQQGRAPLLQGDHRGAVVYGEEGPVFLDDTAPAPPPLTGARGHGPTTRISPPMWWTT